jgi:hypothetical protein
MENTINPSLISNKTGQQLMNNCNLGNYSSRGNHNKTCNFTKEKIYTSYLSDNGNHVIFLLR